MAKAPRTIKKADTFREQGAKKRSKSAQPRRIRRTASSAKKAMLYVKNVAVSILRRFNFLLTPFRTRPMRFIGRVLSKVLLINYFSASWSELRQVTWPGRKETIKLTFAVVVFALVFGLFITVVDYGLDKLFRFIIL